MDKKEKCPDCGTALGEPHKNDCDIQRCSECGGQKISCDCATHTPSKSVWNDEWPESQDCDDDDVEELLTDKTENKMRTYRGYVIVEVLIEIDVEATSAEMAKAKADTWNGDYADGISQVGDYSCVTDNDPREKEGEMMCWGITDIKGIKRYSFKEEDADDEPLF
tara:strand:+ start:16433 stop:16927 length:495 start_codon:yes stop_codon:yes gene_type:complete